ncbi:MAG: lysozyme [Rickettsiaceae bacterium]|nr:lysozyme [Rickettsiaceae bacterium]
MKTSKTGIDLIKKFEGFSASAYKCSAGFWTIGYGHKMEGENFTNINMKVAEQLLIKDLIISELSVVRNIKHHLTQNQFDSLVSFTYNVGGGALQRSTLRQKINNKEFDAVEIEFLRWVKIRGITITGLVIRRRMEASLFFS